MTTPPYAADLVEQLTSIVDKSLDSVPVVELAPPDAGKARGRLDAMLRLTGLLPTDLEPIGDDPARTVLRGPAGVRAVAFHASGALVVKHGIAPHDRLFDGDPGDEELVAMVEQTTERLGLRKLVPEDDQLTFERLWRIKAAGCDRAGRRSKPVLCRVVGAYRHQIHGLPVYGRASATVELAGTGELVSTSVSMRRLEGDGGGRAVADATVRPPRDAAEQVTARMVEAFGGLTDLRGTELVATSFRLGYFSLERRHEQAVLAPHYIATIEVDGTDEHSAHMIVVPGSKEKYLQVPAGVPSSAPDRPRTWRARRGSPPQR